MMYFVIAILVLVFSGLMAMAGLGTAFLFVPLFYYLGVPLSVAMPTALVLNVISLLSATVSYGRAVLVKWRLGLPIMVGAMVAAPAGARLTTAVNQELLLGLFAAFLIFAGGMMLLGPQPRQRRTSRSVELSISVAVGSVAGFLGGLLGIGGGNIVLPVLTWLGLDPKHAAGTTALVVVGASLAGFAGHATLGGLDLRLLGSTMLMAMLGSLVGAQLMQHKLSGIQLRRGIGVLLWLIAAKMLWDLTFA